MCGQEHLFQNKGHFYVEKNKVLSYQAPRGVRMETEELPNGIKARVVVKKNVKIKEPLFFCFGLLGKKEEQLIVPEIIIEDGAEVFIFAHCSFPHAVTSRHDMKAVFRVGKGAKFHYQEHHYHGEKSGATVVPKMELRIDEGGYFQSAFNLSRGTVGHVDIQVDAHLAKEARSEIETKVLGKNEKDVVSILDRVWLEGENSKSLIKMRAAAVGGGQVLMQGETYAQAPGAIGHVDCQEIVSGNSVAKAIPIVEVTNDQARVTHEASVGKINQKELETLMTRGLSEEEATELIIEALMK